MIRVIDYGVGNVQAFLNLFKCLGIESGRGGNPDELQDAKRLVLPGVGHFDHAMNLLNNSGLKPELERLVLQETVPIIGVCVGMQMLGDRSDEGSLSGLGWLPGSVKSFSSNPQMEGLPKPHMGWNTVNFRQNSCLFQSGFVDKPQFYFLHSFYFEPIDENDVAAYSHYGAPFASAVSHDHIHGVQFHPEKSHHWGSTLLKNFSKAS